MSHDASAAGATQESWGQGLYRSWEQFWFRPADPTVLGLMRICCGIVTLCTMIVYSFDLPAFVGEDGWMDLETRMATVRDDPVVREPLRGSEVPLTPPRDAGEKRYLAEYVQEFHELPPGPYPRNDDEKGYCFQFRRQYGIDLRIHGLPPPQDPTQWAYLSEFMKEIKQPLAPPYPRSPAEMKQRLKYAMRHNADPQRLLARGRPVFSLWFHVTDPTEMYLLHGTVIVVTLLFLVGFCTRLTSVLTWFFFVNYAHRTPVMLYGVDVMTNIVLLYLMIGPSGAALSVDRLLARRWGRNKSATADPEPSVSANFAIRLLQIHVCIIYFVSGTAKLLGPAWWNGTAVWGTLASYELAPMQLAIYQTLLRFLAHNDLVFSLFLFLGTYFTLAFEIAYPFLIWRPSFRRLFLGSAILLHGMIGVVMGLRSFSLMMLVMNMAFLTSTETRWLLGQLRRLRPPSWART